MNPQVQKLKLQLDLLKVTDQPSLKKQRSLLRRLLKTGSDIRGYGSMIKTHGSHLTGLVGSWARRRGRSFQLEMMGLIQSILDKEPRSGVVYRASTEKYGVQPYDLVIYLHSRRPMFLECKAGGFQENSRSFVIQKGSRSMKNLGQRIPDLEVLIQRTGAPYLFLFPHRGAGVLVPARLILQPRTRVTIPKDRVYVLDSQTSLEELIRWYEIQIQV